MGGPGMGPPTVRSRRLLAGLHARLERREYRRTLLVRQLGHRRLRPGNRVSRLARGVDDRRLDVDRLERIDRRRRAALGRGQLTPLPLQLDHYRPDSEGHQLLGGNRREVQISHERETRRLVRLVLLDTPLDLSLLARDLDLGRKAFVRLQNADSHVSHLQKCGLTLSTRVTNRRKPEPGNQTPRAEDIAGGPRA